MQSVSEIMNTFLNAVGTECSGAAEGDYLNDDGLLVCHVCGKQKQMRLKIPMIADDNSSKERIVPCACDCDKARYRAEDERQKRMDEERRVRELLRYSIVDEGFRSSTFANMQITSENQDTATLANAYVANFDQLYARNKGLLLYGEPGTGKSFMAACIANALIDKHVSVVVTSIIRFTAGTFGNSEELQERIAKMNSARLLVLDDLGAERGTETAMEMVYNIIDSRYGARKPMIVTTNLSLPEMRNETDIRKRRVYDRILEVCHPVQLTGESWRLKTARSDYDEIERLLGK